MFYLALFAPIMSALLLQHIAVRKTLPRILTVAVIGVFMLTAIPQVVKYTSLSSPIQVPEKILSIIQDAQAQQEYLYTDARTMSTIYLNSKTNTEWLFTTPLDSLDGYLISPEKMSEAGVAYVLDTNRLNWASFFISETKTQLPPSVALLVDENNYQLYRLVKGR